MNKNAFAEQTGIRGAARAVVLLSETRWAASA